MRDRPARQPSEVRSRLCYSCNTLLHFLQQTSVTAKVVANFANEDPTLSEDFDKGAIRAVSVVSWNAMENQFYITTPQAVIRYLTAENATFSITTPQNVFFVIKWTEATETVYKFNPANKVDRNNSGIVQVAAGTFESCPGLMATESIKQGCGPGRLRGNPHPHTCLPRHHRVYRHGPQQVLHQLRGRPSPHHGWVPSRHALHHHLRIARPPTY